MAQLSKEQRRYLEKATLQYAKHLDEAAEWLEVRGLDLEFARSNALGVVRDPLPGHEHLVGRLAIPYLTDVGPVNVSFRCLQDHDCKAQENHSKYMYKKGSGTNLYGVQTASWADEWIVATEGEIDALTWHQIGVPALGISGVKKWEDHWANVFEDFSRVYLAEDGDDAGKWLWDKMSSELNNVIRMKMPNGEDSNSVFVKYGKDRLLGMIRK
jgi:DNA primase